MFGRTNSCWTFKDLDLYLAVRKKTSLDTKYKLNIGQQKIAYKIIKFVTMICMFNPKFWIVYDRLQKIIGG
jgi:hypothetical protein